MHKSLSARRASPHVAEWISLIAHGAISRTAAEALIHAVRLYTCKRIDMIIIGGELEGPEALNSGSTIRWLRPISGNGAAIRNAAIRASTFDNVLFVQGEPA